MRKRHIVVDKAAKFQVKVGDAVIVRSENKNRGKWPLAIVEAIYPGPNGHTRAVQLRTSKGGIQRPVQHLYPLKLHSEPRIAQPSLERQLNSNAASFRPRRAAANTAAARNGQIAEGEESEQL